MENNPTPNAGELIKRYNAPSNEQGRLVLLFGHLQLLTQPPEASYASRAPRPEHYRLEWARDRERHLTGLAQLMQIVSPGAPLEWDTVRNRAIGIHALRDAWHQIVINGDPTSTKVAQAVKLGEDLLVRSCVATSCYANEIVGVLTHPEDAMVLLSRAARNAKDFHDYNAITGAIANVQRHVEKRLQERIPSSIEMVSPTPGAKKEMRYAVDRNFLLRIMR